MPLRLLLRRAVLTSVLVAPAACGKSPTEPPVSWPDPDAALIVTSDIPTFWAAFEQIDSSAAGS